METLSPSFPLNQTLAVLVWVSISGANHHHHADRLPPVVSLRQSSNCHHQEDLLLSHLFIAGVFAGNFHSKVSFFSSRGIYGFPLSWSSRSILKATSSRIGVVDMKPGLWIARRESLARDGNGGSRCDSGGRGFGGLAGSGEGGCVSGTVGGGCDTLGFVPGFCWARAISVRFPLWALAG